jgi:predicted GH43/DUF377 family glycosyl hydrolase
MCRYIVLLLSLFLLASCEGHREAYFTLSPSAAPPLEAPFKLSAQTDSPVLERGASGTWDSIDVLNPSVIRFKGQLLNFYSGFDGSTWRTGLATSTDGVHWVKHPQAVLSTGGAWDTQYIAANGAAIEWNHKILYLYQGQDAKGTTRIGLATSDNGLHFDKAASPVLDVGSEHAWDSKAVGDPYLIARNGVLYLYYLGMDEHNIQRLGVAKSTDGKHWTKFSGNPILDVGAAGSFDENGLGEPSVVFSAPFYYMIYTGRDANENRNLGYAVSSDGVSWKKMSITGIFNDRHAWNSKVVCDSTILQNGDGSFSIWYGGGNIARPDERINGQIGRFKLNLMPPAVASGFDASFDYSAAGLRSPSILHGSWNIEDGSAWAGPDASVTIWNTPSDGQSIDISGWVPVSLYRKAGVKTAISLRVLVNGKQVVKKEFTQDEVFTLKINVSELEGIKAPMLVELVTDHSFVPSSFSNSQDRRTLSLKVSRIQLSP